MLGFLGRPACHYRIRFDMARKNAKAPGEEQNLRAATWDRGTVLGNMARKNARVPGEEQNVITAAWDKRNNIANGAEKC